MADADWVILASGASLTDDDVEYVRQSDAFVCVVNDTWRKMPDADLLYAADERWWNKYGDEVTEQFEGKKWTQNVPSSKRFGLKLVRIGQLYGWCSTPYIVASGQLSGYQAINLVGHFKPRRIILLGYDMQHTGGKVHWFGNHPKGWPNSQNLHLQVRHFDAMAKEATVPILNASRETALTCFPRVRLRDVL
jgi:hypothetical protein